MTAKELRELSSEDLIHKFLRALSAYCENRTQQLFEITNSYERELLRRLDVYDQYKEAPKQEKILKDCFH